MGFKMGYRGQQVIVIAHWNIPPVKLPPKLPTHEWVRRGTPGGYLGAILEAYLIEIR